LYSRRLACPIERGNGFLLIMVNIIVLDSTEVMDCSDNSKKVIRSDIDRNLVLRKIDKVKPKNSRELQRGAASHSATKGNSQDKCPFSRISLEPEILG
jgi:hypothetical protein